MNGLSTIPVTEILTWVIAIAIAVIVIGLALRFIFRMAARLFACSIAIILLVGLAYLVINYLR